jgi:hypothetical protein
MVYYLGTDSEAPLFPVWDKAAPAFYVASVGDNELERVRNKLPHRNLRYLGSHNGCGCGFRSYRDGILISEKADATDTNGDHFALTQYLRELPSSSRQSQIFGCWSGDEGEPVEFERTIAPEEILNPNFGFKEREIVTLEI